MKKIKKNNKGFSLVELIVVVLIMAIIAVALAPQVMKWVGHSRTSTDAQTYDSLVENITLALTDEEVLAEVKAIGDTSTIIFTISDTGTVITTNPDGKTTTALETKMNEICGSGWTDTAKKKDSSQPDYVITVKADATVERTTPPDTDAVK